ncbi:MAG: hypothetical protein AAF307_06850 [Pseudomonadota bacterium]
MSYHRRTVLIVLLVIAVFAAVVRDNPLTRAAQDYAQSIATTSAGTYVTLRTLNAFLSTAQEVEVGVSIIASGNAQPLKMLEPIDDTIERIAGLVFAVMVATGVIAVSLGPVSGMGWALFALAVALSLLRGGGARGMSTPLATYGALLGLGIPLALALSAWLATVLTAGVYRENLAVLQDITQLVSGAEDIESAAPGLSEYRALAVNVWERADELISALITILSVYVFRLFVMPILLIIGMFLLARRLAG